MPGTSTVLSFAEQPENSHVAIRFWVVDNDMDRHILPDNRHETSNGDKS
jgi:hypothetical protein